MKKERIKVQDSSKPKRSLEREEGHHHDRIQNRNPSLIVLVDVHLLLDLLHKALLLLVLRSRASRSNARLLFVRNDARFLVLRQSRAGPASRLGSADVARGIAARGRREVGIDGVDLHALALGVRVLADLLAAGEGDGVGVDVGGASLLGRLRWCDGGAAASKRVGRFGGARHANGLIRDVGSGVGRA